MTIVCNPSPISNLAAINQLLLLQQVYGAVTIPEAVATEIAKVGLLYSQAESVPFQSWISMQSVTNSIRVQQLQSKKLDLGEAEAIALAIELEAELLVIDEQLGRKIAAQAGLNIIGLLGVLLEAKKRNLIQKVMPIMDELMIQAGFRIGASLYVEVLRLTEEDELI
jgi:predicted nucleic acid-binding protein